MRLTRAFCLLAVVGLVVPAVACQAPRSLVVPPAVPATPTPSPTTGPTPTVSPLRLWASAGLPMDLRSAALGLQQIGGRPVEWVSDPASAEVRLEPDPERPLARWTYAAVAPFPTISDGLSFGELQEAWTSGSRLLVGTGDQGALESLLGPGQALAVPPASLLDTAWLAGQSLAIVPFEALEPRWKVLEVDGQSPVRKQFDPDSYPLTVWFGLSGDPDWLEAVERTLAWPAGNRDPDQLTVVVLTGVSALVRATAWRMDRFGPSYPGLAIGDWIREADLAHVSHEASFHLGCPPPEPYSTSLRFCANPNHVSLFQELGVDLIELTGNHLQDYGPDPLRFTLGLYEGLGIQTFGGGLDLSRAREPALIEHHGNRLAFLGCNAAGPRADWASDGGPGARPCQDEGLLEQVAALTAQGYRVVFTFQWLESLSPRPLPEQATAFRAVSEAGATIVNGSQAHRPQAMEFHAGGFIHFGLGNLFFDQMHSPELRQEFLDRHVFYGGRHISIELLTALLEDYAQPRPMDAAERAELLAEVFAVSGW